MALLLVIPLFIMALITGVKSWLSEPVEPSR
jgi:hypothetical protein